MSNKKITATFNIFKTGREYSNKERGYVLDNVTKVINSPIVQERVRTRQAFGYFGHTIRELAGKMSLGAKNVLKLPSGQEIVADAVPGCVCTALSIDDKGNVTHTQEVFTSTNDGKSMLALHDAKAGGFSWAASGAVNSGNTILDDWFGFDYVPNPLNLNNNGFGLVLDDVESETTPGREDIIKALKGAKIDKPGAIMDSWFASQSLELTRVSQEKDDLKLVCAGQAEEIADLKSQINDSHEDAESELDTLKRKLAGANAEVSRLNALEVPTFDSERQQLIADHAKAIKDLKAKHSNDLREKDRENKAVFDELESTATNDRAGFFKKVGETSHIHIPESILDSFANGTNAEQVADYLNSISKLQTSHLPVGELKESYVMTRPFTEDDDITPIGPIPSMKM